MAEKERVMDRPIHIYSMFEGNIHMSIQEEERHLTRSVGHLVTLGTPCEDNAREGKVDIFS